MRSCITPDVWHKFSAPLEGRIHSMYLDVKGLVTTGVGNLIDSVGAAQGLPWKHADGSLAAPADVAIAWRSLKARQDLAHRHWSEAAKLNDLRLPDEAIDALVWHQLIANEGALRGQFRDWDEWPADAQLAAHSMAWAVGAGWPAKFPKCRLLLNGHEFIGAGTAFTITDGGSISGVEVATTPSGMRVTGSAVCDIRTDGNPGVIPRNALNRLHFLAAGSELARRYPDVLHGPCSLDAIRAGWTMADLPGEPHGNERPV